MGKLTKKKTIIIEKEYGFCCDRCGEIIDYSNSTRTDSFKIDYSFGYGTEYDGDSIVAYICDNCLIDIVKKEIPNAIVNKCDW